MHQLGVEPEGDSYPRERLESLKSAAEGFGRGCNSQNPYILSLGFLCHGDVVWEEVNMAMHVGDHVKAFDAKVFTSIKPRRNTSAKEARNTGSSGNGPERLTHFSGPSFMARYADLTASRSSGSSTSFNVGKR